MWLYYSMGLNQDVNSIGYKSLKVHVDVMTWFCTLFHTARDICRHSMQYAISYKTRNTNHERRKYKYQLSVEQIKNQEFPKTR